jgi:hypothetical protein
MKYEDSGHCPNNLVGVSLILAFPDLKLRVQYPDAMILAIL